MEELQVFCYENRDIRTLLVGGEIWWVLKDVCAALSIKNSRDAASRLEEDEKGVGQIYTPSGVQAVTTVNEPGLYSVILRSEKPQAKAFKRWITHEVIPAIRRTGQYSAIPGGLTNLDYLRAADTVARCPDKRLPYVLSLLETSGVDLHAMQLRAQSLAPRRGRGMVLREVEPDLTEEERDELIGEASRRLRETRLIVSRVAEQVGVTPALLYLCRAGRKGISAKTATRLIEVLDQMEVKQNVDSERND